MDKGQPSTSPQPPPANDSSEGSPALKPKQPQQQQPPLLLAKVDVSQQQQEVHPPFKMHYVPPPSQGARRLLDVTASKYKKGSSSNSTPLYQSSAAAATRSGSPSKQQQLKGVNHLTHIPPPPSSALSPARKKQQEQSMPLVATSTLDNLTFALAKALEVLEIIPDTAALGKKWSAQEFERTALEAIAAKPKLVDLIAASHGVAAKALAERDLLQQRSSELEAEAASLRKELGETQDLLIAADERISEMHKGNAALRSQCHAQQQEFDRRLLELTSNKAVTRRQLEGYQNDDMEKMALQIRALSATIQRQERSNMEKEGLAQHVQRLENENRSHLSTIDELKEKIDAAAVELRALEAKHAAERGSFAERERQMKRMVERGATSAHRFAVAAVLQSSNVQKLVSVAFNKWRGWLLRNRTGQLNREVFEKRKAEVVSRDNFRTKFKDEKVQLQQDIWLLTRRNEDLRKDNEKMKKELEELRTIQAALTRSPGTSSLSLGKGDKSGFTSEEMQLQALDAYNKMIPVLNGLQRRLGLQSMKPEPLKLQQNPTEHIGLSVIKWIIQNISFLHRLFTIDDTLTKTKHRLIFLNIQLRPRIKRMTEEFEDKTTSVPKKGVLREQLRNFEELVVGIRSLLSHIDASRKSLFTAITPQQQKETEILAHTFEADYEAFQRQYKRSMAMQFNFDLQRLKLDDTAKRRSLRDKILASAGAHSSNSGGSRAATPVGTVKHLKEQLQQQQQLSSLMASKAAANAAVSAMSSDHPMSNIQSLLICSIGSGPSPSGGSSGGLVPEPSVHSILQKRMESTPVIAAARASMHKATAKHHQGGGGGTPYSSPAPQLAVKGGSE